MAIDKQSQPQKTLVVLLGASEWEKSPNLGKSPAFLKSAERLKNYFISKFGLTKDNLLDLFDSEQSCDEIDETIGDWLENKLLPKGETEQVFTDLIVIYIGHGDFINGKDEFILAIRRTRESNYAASSIHISSLAKTIKEKARFLRRYIILDCCFAASAFIHFQQASDVAKAATVQTLEAFSASGKGYGIPQKGTALLCSSRHNKPSRLSPNQQSTMFSEALLYSLENGNPQYQELISPETVCQLAQDYLQKTYQDDAPRPEIHSPDQSEGNVAAFPLFPNFSEIKLNSTETNSSLTTDSLDENTSVVSESSVKKIPTGESQEIFDETAIRNKIKEEPNKAQLYADLGQVFIDQARWNDAIESLEKAIKLNPNIAIWHYNLAIALIENKDSASDIEKTFEQAIELTPLNARFRIDYAHFLSSNRKWTDVIHQLNFVISKDPENEEAAAQLTIASRQHNLAEETYLAGRESENAGNITQALECYRKTHLIEVDFEDTNSRITRLLSEQDRLLKFNKVQNYISNIPDESQKHVILGNYYLDQRNFKEADANYQLALKSEPNSSYIHSCIGKLHFAKENWSLAEASFQKSVELDPQNAVRHNELGAVMFAQMKWKEAIEHYKMATKLAPENPNFRNNLATAESRRLQQIIKSNKKIIQIIIIAIVLFVLIMIYVEFL